jgi:hypothetical protein
MKIFRDILKNPEGKWSRKSLTAFASFIGALLYESILPIIGVETKEYVFITLITLTAATLGLTVWNKFVK